MTGIEEDCSNKKGSMKLLSKVMNSLSIHLNDKTIIPKIVFGLAALVLAIDPVLWLVQTWRDPSYDSSGFIVFLFVPEFFYGVSPAID